MDSVSEQVGEEGVRVWLDPCGSIMVKVVEQNGDPVELSEGQARDLADLLNQLADTLAV